MAWRVDIHCDETDDEHSRFVEVMAAETIRRGMSGRVTASHTTAMHSYNNAYAYRLISNIARAGLHMVTNPLDNSVLQGRFDTGPIRRGHTRVKELQAAGVNVCIGHDSVMDPWYPLGYGDPLQAAFVLAHFGQMSGDSELRRLIEMITVNPAAALGVPDYGLRPGGPADLVVFDAPSEADALRLVAPRTLVLRGGKVVARATPAQHTVVWDGAEEQVTLPADVSDGARQEVAGAVGPVPVWSDLYRPRPVLPRQAPPGSSCRPLSPWIRKKSQYSSAASTKPTSKVRSPNAGWCFGHHAGVVGLVGEQPDGYADRDRHGGEPGPRVVLAVEQEPGHLLAAAQELVGEEDAQPRPDPVRDDEQEVVVLRAGVGEPGQRDEEAGDAEHDGHDRAAQRQRQLDAEREERHRAGVHVQRVRADRAERDRQQGDVARSRSAGG